MKKKLQEAIEANDIPAVRSILTAMATAKGSSVSSLEDMAEAIARTKDLFDHDDGKIYAESAKELTETEIEALREDIVHNFSIAKFKLLVEVQEIEHTHPNYFKKHVKETTETVDYPEGELTIAEEVVDGTPVVAVVSEEVNATTDKEN